MDDVVTAPLQFFRHRGFAGAGNAFDQLVSYAHLVLVAPSLTAVG
ncbi:hypothetical protein GGD56_005392 [Rhizobium mongolense]|uniref:Uncharacterized protein n=1 Tax=Rhizobium mongolense TaxID=57676 RepID=A0ABR6IVM1_9HYPH|nr:hypothetical protein [Rhizobium mongolense]